MSQPQFESLQVDDIYWWKPLGDGASTDTRSIILFAAYREIHLHGFQAASLNDILAHTGVSKGALYHHFPNKTELGYAVIDEVIAERINLSFVEPLKQADDAIAALIELIQHSGQAFTLRDIELGCPLGNLSQEMAAIDEGFRKRLSRIYDLWHGAIITAVRDAQNKGAIIDAVQPEQAAAMVVATMEGCLSAGKISQDLGKLQACGEGLIQYLKLIQKQQHQPGRIT